MNRNVFLWNGAVLMVIGMVMASTSTKAFGNHFIPETTPEALADLIGMIVTLTGFVLYTVGRALPKRN
jgi:hypothetical protein